jgi:hypothetical protein
MTDPIDQAFAYLDIGHPTVKAALAEIARLRALESRVLAERKEPVFKVIGKDKVEFPILSEHHFANETVLRIDATHPTPDDASPTKLEMLGYELDGVLIDARNGRFDEVCLRTVERVRNGIAAIDRARQSGEKN